jgi:hypothetical protein
MGGSKLSKDDIKWLEAEGAKEDLKGLSFVERRRVMARGEKIIKAEQQAEVLGYSIGIYIDKAVSTSDIPKKITIELPDIDLGL